MKNGILKLTSRDGIKAALLAILTIPVTYIVGITVKGSLDIDWQVVVAGMITGGLPYLVMKLGTKNDGSIPAVGLPASVPPKAKS